MGVIAGTINKARVGRVASGPLRCQNCKHEWQQEYEIPHSGLLCPNCGFCKGFAKGKFTGGKDDAVYECACGESLLNLCQRPDKTKYLLCISCGSASANL